MLTYAYVQFQSLKTGLDTAKYWIAEDLERFDLNGAFDVNQI